MSTRRVDRKFLHELARGFQQCLKDDLKLLLCEVKEIRNPAKRTRCLAALADVSEFLGVKGLEVS